MVKKRVKRTKYVKCRRCQGTGLLDCREICRACGGKGKIEDISNL